MACRDIKRRLEKVGIEAEKVKPGINMGAYFTVRDKIICQIFIAFLVS